MTDHQKATEVYQAIAEKWGLTDDDSRKLFGEGDVLTRISYVVHIYKSLHILLPDEYADQWMTRPNDNPLFQGQTPLDHIHRSKDLGGIQRVLALLEAQCQG